MSRMMMPITPTPVHLPIALVLSPILTNSEEQEEAIARLCADLKRPLPLPQPVLPCPDPGMEPFTEESCDRFFGRDGEIEELLECLRLQTFLTVIGPSGSGKSSLVFAGLIP